MAITQIEVNTDRLNGDVSSLTSELNQIRNEMNSMFQSMQELDAMWDGPASEAFKVQFQSDYDAMNDLCKILQNMINCMENASSEYVRGENMIHAIVNAIRI